MAKISERPVDPDTLSMLQGCARDGLNLLNLAATAAAEPRDVVEAIDAFVYAWQKGNRPPADKLDPQDAPYMFGGLWGEQLVKRFGWQWAMVTFHDHGNSVAPGVLSPDRALAVYPIHFLIGCFQNPQVDATIALSFNMLEAGSIKRMPPANGYFNLMDGVHRVVPRG